MFNLFKMAKKKEVAVEPVEEVVVETVCSNCDNNGRACSVCHAGDMVE